MFLAVCSTVLTLPLRVEMVDLLPLAVCSTVFSLPSWFEILALLLLAVLRIVLMSSFWSAKVVVIVASFWLMSTATPGCMVTGMESLSTVPSANVTVSGMAD